MVRTRRRRIGLWVGAGVLVVALIAAGAAIAAYVTRTTAGPPECRVATDTGSYVLELEQAQNASTIAAVGKLEGLPDHAVTVALAAALQESNLRNLGYGDRDSVGLFQQRPSQGWGAREQLLIPAFAAAAFYRELERTRGWESLPVNDAAQRVQRSGAPDAYAKWEGEARDLAVALTGERPASVTCQFPLASASTPPPSYTPALERELGIAGLGANLSSARAWTAAAWLVTHAQDYRIKSVALAGQEWTPASGRWKPSSRAAGNQLRVTQA